MTTTITINGTVITQTHSGSGDSISINNGKVIVNGQDVTPDSKSISISLVGDVKSIEADVCDVIEIQGNVTGSVKSQSGDIKCGTVNGSVSTMSGDVVASDVHGNASTMSGDIITR